MIHVGIDPGVSGGLAFIDDQGTVFAARKMPDNETELLLQLTGGFLDQAGARQRAVLERVHGGIGGPGGRRQGAAGMFTYGRNYGAILMALTAARIPFDTVPPQTWQKVVGVVYPKGATQTERKNISKRRAQQLFPSLTVTHAIADALLLADYCRRINAGAPREFKHGEEENRQAVGQFPEARRARETSEAKQLEELAAGEREDYERSQADELTAKERREAGHAPGNGAGPRRKARSVVRIVG